jgi:hypothetical protein
MKYNYRRDLGNIRKKKTKEPKNFFKNLVALFRH